jgi:hypothetical protein
MFSALSFTQTTSGCTVQLKFKLLSMEKAETQETLKHSRQYCEEHVNNRAADFCFYQLRDIISDLRSQVNWYDEVSATILKQAAVDLSNSTNSVGIAARLRHLQQFVIEPVNTMAASLPILNNERKRITWALDDVRRLMQFTLNAIN